MDGRGAPQRLDLEGHDVRHVLLFFPRLVLAITCVVFILITAPLLMLLGADREKYLP